MMTQALPLCWCGDPGTHALESVGMPGVGDLERRWWRIDRGRRSTIVTRCRAHAGPFGEELTDEVEVLPCYPWPIDAEPYDVALPFAPD